MHAELVTEWVKRLRPDADDALLLAARGHHFRRWTLPRSSYPAGPRRLPALAQALARPARARARRAPRASGYDDATIGRARAGARAQGRPRSPGADADVQVLEDALCLVFLETQLADVAARLEPDDARRACSSRPRTR